MVAPVVEHELVIVVCKHAEGTSACERCPIHLAHKAGLWLGPLLCVPPDTQVGRQLLELFEEIAKQAKPEPPEEEGQESA